MSHKPQNILYVGRFGLPNTAAGIRVSNNAKILIALGCTVHCLCYMHNECEYVETSEGISYHFITPKATGCISSLCNMIELLSAHEMFREVTRCVKANSIDTIILYNDLFMLTYRLVRWCKKHNIRLVADVTEWYERPHGRVKFADRLIPYLTDKRIRFLDAKVHNIIAISPYLLDYYRKLGCKVMLLPPVFDTALLDTFPKINMVSHARLKLVYAGAPGPNKDLIEPLLRAIERINSDVLRVELHIVGLIESDLGRYVEFEDFARKGIFTYGRVPHERTLDIVQSCDIGVLLRRPLRYAMAGFSTKLAESMFLGVPMLCNRVGGADMLLRDREDGLLIDSADTESLIKVVDQLCNMSYDELCNMKIAARKRAIELFSLQHYIGNMQQFLQ